MMKRLCSSCSLHSFEAWTAKISWHSPVPVARDAIGITSNRLRRDPNLRARMAYSL